MSTTLVELQRAFVPSLYFPRDFSELSGLLSHNEFDNVRFALRFCQIPMFAFNASLI